MDASPTNEMDGATDMEGRVAEYWDWITVALYLLVTVDMVTTVFAARVVGIGAEANPIVRWALTSGPFAFAAVNLVTVVLVVGLFDRLIGRLRRTTAPVDRYLAVGIEVWLGLLVAVGLFVFANNLSVIVYGRSLL